MPSETSDGLFNPCHLDKTMPLKAEALRGRALRHIFSDGLKEGIETLLMTQRPAMSGYAVQKNVGALYLRTDRAESR